MFASKYGGKTADIMKTGTWGDLEKRRKGGYFKDERLLANKLAVLGEIGYKAGGGTKGSEAKYANIKAIQGIFGKDIGMPLITMIMSAMEKTQGDPQKATQELLKTTTFSID